MNAATRTQALQVTEDSHKTNTRANTFRVKITSNLLETKTITQTKVSEFAINSTPLSKMEMDSTRDIINPIISDNRMASKSRTINIIINMLGGNLRIKLIPLVINSIPIPA